MKAKDLWFDDNSITHIHGKRMIATTKPKVGDDSVATKLNMKEIHLQALVGFMLWLISMVDANLYHHISRLHS